MLNTEPLSQTDQEAQIEKRHRRRSRSSPDAETLNTAQVYERFGLDRGKLYYETKRFDETEGREGLPYIRIAGRQGRKGTLLFRTSDLRAFIDRHSAPMPIR